MHSQAALDAALDVTAADEVAFGGGELATLNQEEIVARMAAQRQFNQDFGPVVEQELLETLSVPERLRREAGLLGGQVRELAERWQELRRTKYAGAALN